MLANMTESRHMPRWMSLLTKTYYVRSNLQRNANNVTNWWAIIVIN